MGRSAAAEPAVAGEAECRRVKGIGEPDAGEPHVRFDGERLETGIAMARGDGRRRETDGMSATAYGSHRASLLPY